MREALFVALAGRAQDLRFKDRNELPERGRFSLSTESSWLSACAAPCTDAVAYTEDAVIECGDVLDDLGNEGLLVFREAS